MAAFPDSPGDLEPNLHASHPWHYGSRHEGVRNAG